MSLSYNILRNIAGNWTGYAVNAAVTFLMTPFVLHRLGDARYGVWILAASIIGYYGLLDLGFRAGLTQYLTRYMAVRDYEKVNECMSSSALILSTVGALLAVSSCLVAHIVLHFYHFPPGTEHEVYWCILIVGVSSGLGFVFFPFMAVFTAKQRFDLSNLIGVATRLLSAGAIYASLRMECGLIGISVATCGASFVDYLIRWRVAYRLIPQLSISLRQVRVTQLRGIGSFGLWNFLISVSIYIYQYAHMLIIAFFLPIEAATFYGLAMGLSEQIRDFFGSMAQVFYPAATDLHFSGERVTLERLYCDGTRLMLLVTIPVVLIASFWAQDFYRIWVGGKYLAGTPFPSVALLLQILLIGTTSLNVSAIGGQILLGAGMVRVTAVCVFVQAILNLALSLTVIGPYGLAGVAVSGVFASLVVRLVVFPIILQKALGLRLKLLLKACVRPLTVGVLLSPLLVCIRLTGQPGSWSQMILQGALAGACAAAIVLVIGVTNEERQRFLLRPVRHLLGISIVATANAKCNRK